MAGKCFADILARRDEYLATYASRAVCAPELCAATVDGKPLYADEAHITESSAGFWVKMLEPN